MDRVHLDIRSQWRQRYETPQQVASRLSELLKAFAEIDPKLGRWFKRSMKKPTLEPLFPTNPVISDVEQAVRAGAQFKDTTPPESWPERGYAVAGWNGAPDGEPSAAFTLRIGAIHEKLAAFNRFEITLSDAAGSASLLSAENVERMIAAIVANLEPSVLDVATRKWLHGAPAEFDLACPAGGWMSYVRNGDGREFEVPDGISSMPMADGVLLLSTPEQDSDSDPNHVRGAYLLNQALATVREFENDFAVRRAPSSFGTAV